MAFDLNKLLEVCATEIRSFAEDHQDEIFYAFALDASLLCLNSEEAFAKTLRQCQETWDYKVRALEFWEDLTESDLRDVDFLLRLYARISTLVPDREAILTELNATRAKKRADGNPYRTAKHVHEFRENPGDWAYQGFAEMTESVGFDSLAYSQHYDKSAEEQKTSAYGKAMDELVERLRSTGAFKCLKTSPEFQAIRVEHDY